jgi:hypothetical protein
VIFIHKVHLGLDGQVMLHPTHALVSSYAKDEIGQRVVVKIEA